VPAFVAADVLNASVDWPTLDVAADLAPLAMLLQWSSGRKSQWYRRIDVDVAGSTALFTEGWRASNSDFVPRLSPRDPPYMHLITLVCCARCSPRVPCLTLSYARRNILV
jgi:hypothetical protein